MSFPVPFLSSLISSQNTNQYANANANVGHASLPLFLSARCCRAEVSFSGGVIGTSVFPHHFHRIFRLPVVSSSSEVSAGTKFLRKINFGGLGGIIIRSLRLIVLCFRHERLLERGAAALNQFHGLFIT